MINMRMKRFLQSGGAAAINLDACPTGFVTPWVKAPQNVGHNDLQFVLASAASEKNRQAPPDPDLSRRGLSWVQEWLRL